MKIQYKSEKITVFESALYRTTSTLIELNHSILIIDPTWLPDEIDFIANTIKNKYPKHHQYLLFTHSDYDHIIGYGKFPKAKVIASASFQDNHLKDQIINQILDFDNEYYIQRDYPISYPKVDYIVTKMGEMIHIDGIEMYFYFAPGHCKDGIFTIIPELNSWVAGDYLSNIEMPFVEDDLTSYFATLHLANDILIKYPSITLLINGHGDIACGKTEIKNRITRDLHYLKLLKDAIDYNQMDADAILSCINTYSENPNLVKAHQRNIEQNKTKNG